MLCSSVVIFLSGMTGCPQSNISTFLTKGVLSFAVVGILFNMIVVFFRLIHTVKTFQSTKAKSFTTTQLYFLIGCGACSTSFVAFTMAANMGHLTLLFTILLCICFGTVFTFGAKRFTALLSELGNAEMASAASRYMVRMKFVLGFYVLFASITVYATLNLSNISTRTPAMVWMETLAGNAYYNCIVLGFNAAYVYLSDHTGRRK